MRMRVYVCAYLRECACARVRVCTSVRVRDVLRGWVWTLVAGCPGKEILLKWFHNFPRVISSGNDALVILIAL